MMNLSDWQEWELRNQECCPKQTTQDASMHRFTGAYWQNDNRQA
jgi:hypothetical protein